MMTVKQGNIFFDESDAHFIRKFGYEKASEMVLDFKSVNDLPFIFDTWQLASFFNTSRKKLFDYSKNASSHYKRIVIKKKNGKDRILYSPDDVLKFYQTKILREILYKLPVSQYATAYVKGRNLSENASVHVSKKFILKLDITDFFAGITSDRVYSAVFNTRYFPKFIGYILTSLCCRNYSLPQGAPTSPAISNIVMRNFDCYIGSWCEKHAIHYTRYCDDLTFSSDKPLFHVYKKAESFLEKMGFQLNESKTHFAVESGRQCVTGLIVNEKLSVPAEYKRKLRAEIFYALKYGLADCISHCKMQDFIMDGKPDEIKYFHYLLGRLNFVLSIEPSNKWFSSVYKKFMLLDPSKDLN